MNYHPTCTSRLVVQHPCQVSFKSMQGCRRSWEDKLNCVKILSVKDHNSAKICRTWIISPHALLDLWCNIPAKFHSNPCKDVGGVEKTKFDVTEWRKDGMTEWRTKQTLNAPLPFYGGGIKILSVKGHNSAKICRTWIISPYALLDLWYNICTKFHSNPCKDVGGVEKTNFDGKEWRNGGMTEWRKEGMMEGRNDGQSKHLMPPCHFMAGALNECYHSNTIEM